MRVCVCVCKRARSRGNWKRANYLGARARKCTATAGMCDVRVCKVS